MRKRMLCLLAVLLLLLACAGCGKPGPVTAHKLHTSAGENWYFGFGRRQIVLLSYNDRTPLYIAGYNNGLEIQDVLDYCEARAVWLDTGAEGILLIGIDCVALDSGTVAKIRSGLADLPNCAAVNVFATHTHAGIDTLGLWGPVGIDGKNSDYMDAVIRAAIEAGREASQRRKPATMYFGQQQTWDICQDSRDPQIYDPNLYQLRLEAEDGSAGLRMLFFGAHAESLRGDNLALSRDFPGQLCDRVTRLTDDYTMFCPGAIGGLIMTRQFVEEAEENLTVTAEKLTECAVSITLAQERQLAPTMTVTRAVFSVPMDNPVFLLYRFLGILGNKVVSADSATDYGVETELSLVQLGDVALTLIPGEIFPELVYGGADDPEGENPKPLCEIAAEHGVDTLLILGLANDEVGYIVPPSDFLVHEQLPYIETVRDETGENHYEETNSLGPLCAPRIADAFTAAVAALQ